MKVFVKKTNQFVKLTENEVHIKPAVIFIVPTEEIIVKDVVRGNIKFPAGEIKNFIIKRKEGIV